MLRGHTTRNLILLTAMAFSSLVAQGMQAAAGVESHSSKNAVGQELMRWLAAFDGSDRAEYRAFILKDFPSGVGHLAQNEGLRSNTGGFDLRQLQEKTRTTATAILQERAGDQFASVTLRVDPTNPHRIVGLEIIPIPRPAGFSFPHLSEQKLIAELRTRLRRSAAAGRFSGAVLIAKNGKPIFQRAFGFADRELHVPNTLDTRFTIGSINKLFTSVAILQLVQEGKVSLDDPLSRYLPNYPNHILATKVTVRELLTNTGGTGDIWGEAFDQHRLELRTLADYVKLFGDRPLRFEPGSRWEYSNYGFILLGRIIEVASGESYYKYVREHIYEPAGMSSTGPDPENQPVSYTRNGTGKWHPVKEQLPYRGTSAGGGYSTVGDLLRFATALVQHKLLNVRLTNQATTGQVKNLYGFYDGFGFGVQSFNGTQCFGHNGAGAGANADLEICGNSRWTVVSLANLDPPAAQQISDFIMDRLPLPKGAH
jgi:CubicO group peptidase (beta-lactamase class C family)